LKNAELVRLLAAQIGTGEAECTTPPSTPSITPLASTPAPDDLRAQADLVVSGLKSKPEGAAEAERETWADSAKKAMKNLDHLWAEVLYSPKVRKYGSPRIDVDYRKKSASLRSRGFTCAPSPLPLKRFRTRGPERGKENGASEAEAPASIGSKFRAARPRKATTTQAAGKIGKKRRPLALKSSSRAQLAEMKFKARLGRSRK